MTETWSVTAMISRSLWVMRMMVLPCALSCAQDAEQVVGLGRRQHAGRLVEDQDVGAAVERLQDLDPLLQADRRARRRWRRDRPRARNRARAAAARARACGDAAVEDDAALGAEHDVLEHGEGLDQHEVLVDHADAGGDRVLLASGSSSACR